MYLPFGDVRELSSPRLDVMSLVAGPAGLASLVNSIRQILLGCRTWA